MRDVTATICFEIEIELEATYTPGRPAYISGPPEHCYPEDPAEWELQKVARVGVPERVDGKWSTKWLDASPELLKALEPFILANETLNDRAHEAICEAADDGYGD